MVAKEYDQADPEELVEETQLPDEEVVEGEVNEISTDGEFIEEEEKSPEEEIEALRQELIEAKAKADENLEGWQRTLAEFANYKKRVERDQQQIFQNATGNIIKRYIEVVDDLERSLKNRPQDGGELSWVEGIELIYHKLLNILENEGVKPMNAEGEFFDPNLHEAVTSEESDQYESGQIIETLQTGYLIGDRVLRPAMVRVAK